MTHLFIYVTIKNMGKTPDYVKRAAKNYRDKFHFISLRLPQDYKERLAAVGISSADIVEMVKKELERRENAEKWP